MAVVTLAAPAGAAQDPPRYDSPAYCEEAMARLGKRSDAVYKACLETEQENYDRVKALWAQIPDTSRSNCHELAMVDGIGSYGLLSTCIEGEIEAAKTLELGQSYRLAKKTPLMPELQPTDPLAALQRVKDVPAGYIIEIVSIDSNAHEDPWYEVIVRDTRGKHRASGWMNSAALSGQTLEPVTR